ncbi:hypothetical protein TNIN_298891 [Trichonephila inaurata madagascariensis]|uniref:Uncharacterized protein n=1 Tax=Trichonephila inaurata madagascariensis TaxID=2747483 RepID=A0A8X6XKK8_9ARAC|nr:hypothetical protein TNIN_298891 [Trichonephila inaurata madagascariensis]
MLRCCLLLCWLKSAEVGVFFLSGFVLNIAGEANILYNMVVGTKTVAASVSTIGVLTLLTGVAVHYRTPRSVSNDILDVLQQSQGGQLQADL